MKHVWSAVTFSAGFSIAFGLINQYGPARMLLQFLVGIPILALASWGWERVAQSRRNQATASSHHSEKDDARDRPPYE